MPLFTVILEYRGTTAISQVRAPSPKAAVAKWAKEFDYKGVLEVGKNTVNQFVKDLTREQVIPVKDTRNVWCSTALADGYMALVNLIETNEAIAAAPPRRLPKPGGRRRR